jgi:TDG/mug DNA glycosylase family protein
MTPERSEQLNLRLEEDLVRELERAAQEEALDRGTMVRRLLRDGLARWRTEHALVGYQAGRISIGRAAEDAGLTQWELLETLRLRNAAHPLTAEKVEGWFSRNEGFRANFPWMGNSITTLADIAPEEGGILLVGLSPRQESIDAGHYYQGRLGQRLWRRLESAHLLKDSVPGKEDEALHRSGHGLTDVIKRPLEGGQRPLPSELLHGAELLRAKVRDWKPGLVIFVFKAAAEAALGQNVVTGPGPNYENSPTFVLPSPYADRGEADAQYDDLVANYESRFHLFNK